MTRKMFLKLLNSDITADIYDTEDENLTEGDLEHIEDVFTDLLNIALTEALEEEEEG